MATDIAMLEAEQTVLEEGSVNEVSGVGARTNDWVERLPKVTTLNAHAPVFHAPPAVMPEMSMFNAPPAVMPEMSMFNAPPAVMPEMSMFDAPPAVMPEDTWDKTLKDLIQSMNLPKAEMINFNGDPIKYWTFIRSFDYNVGHLNIDNEAKLVRLMYYCKGKAFMVIECCAEMADGYERARQLLENRFGDPYFITNEWIKRICNNKRVTNENLQDFADEVRTFAGTMKAVGSEGEVNQGVLVKIIDRLPMYLQNRWQRVVIKIRDRRERPQLNDLLLMVEDSDREVNDPVYGIVNRTLRTAERQEERTGVDGRYKRRVYSASTDAEEGCSLCLGGPHTLFGCGMFKDMRPEKRLEFAKERRLCFNCLRKGHRTTDCRAQSTCSAEGCKFKHSKLLHISGKGNESWAPGGKTGEQGRIKFGQATCGHVGSDGVRVLMPVVEVKVKRADGTNIVAHALLDSGSNSTVCTNHLIERLGVSGQASSLSLTTLKGKSKQTKVTVHKLSVLNKEETSEVELHQVYAMPSLTIKPGSEFTSKDLSRWDYLKDIDIPTFRDVKVDILIGQDSPEALMPLEIRGGSRGQRAPFAVRTLLGWTVNGPISENGNNSASSYFCCAD